MMLHFGSVRLCEERRANQRPHGRLYTHSCAYWIHCNSPSPRGDYHIDYALLSRTLLHTLSCDGGREPLVVGAGLLFHPAGFAPIYH